MKTSFNVVRAAGLAAVGAMLALPVSAGAAVISFDQIGSVSGTVTNVDGTDFIGTDIRFDEISYGSTTVYCDNTGSAHTGTTQCLLNFDTDSGEFVVTAEAGLYDSAGVLLPGLTGATVTVLTGTSMTDWGLAGSTIFFIEGTDTKLAELLEYFGLSGDWTYSNTEIRNPGGFPLGQTVNVTSADIDNSSTVPEPGLLALFGLGLAGLGRQVARRRKR